MAREVINIATGQTTSDGAGVKLKRVFGGHQPERYDPFLMLDEFGSDEAVDYIGGFPSHPHRGFETVTYMLEGRMLHEDNLGNKGLLKSGDVQWMTAARGIVHSEMPQQTEGRMRGFQLWINLPAAEKMRPASYRDIPQQAIPQHVFDGVTYKVVAGNLRLGEEYVTGAVSGQTTQPLYIDIHIDEAKQLNVGVPNGQTALVYIYEGEAEIGAESILLQTGQLGLLSKEGDIEINVKQSARLLVLAGTPINEPIVQHGPFVMNSREEIEQAIDDYRNGRLV